MMDSIFSERHAIEIDKLEQINIPEMKKIFALPILILTLASCGNNDSTPAKTDSADTTKVVKHEPPKPIEKIDPNDTVFEWRRTIVLDGFAGGFDMFRDGKMVVASGEKTNSIELLDTSGHVIRKFGSIGRADSCFRTFSNCVAVGPTGNIYVTDGTQPRVLVFDSLGHFKMVVKFKNGDLIGGIAVNKQGVLYGTIVTGWIMRTYDANGNFIADVSSIKDHGGVIWGFMSGVSMDSSGGIYVCNWRGMGGDIDAVIHECDASGKYLSTFDLNAGHTIVAMTADPVGRIFADDENGILIISHDGKHIGHIGKKGKGDGCFEPESIDAMKVSMSGYLYVMDGKRIQVFK
jgi:hypothetical protein